MRMVRASPECPERPGVALGPQGRRRPGAAAGFLADWAHGGYLWGDIFIRDRPAIMPPLSHSASAASAAPVFGAVDLGTNNCRMLAAVAAPDGFAVVDAFSRIVRLGEGLADSGRLSAAAMDRTIAALDVCAEKLHRLGAVEVRAVTTEACRRADNADGFVARVAAETGIKLEVISGDEEARLTLAGCGPLLMDGPPHVLLFDIGGGSTEIVWADRVDGGFRIADIMSLPVGVVTLSEQSDDRALDALRDALSVFDARHDIAARIGDDAVRMLGTSGTVTTLAALKLGLHHYDRASVDGTTVSRRGIEETGRAVLRMSLADRARHPCIGPERADLVAAGIRVMDAVLETWPADDVLIADRGIREGLLLEMTTAGAIA